MGSQYKDLVELVPGEVWHWEDGGYSEWWMVTDMVEVSNIAAKGLPIGVLLYADITLAYQPVIGEQARMRVYKTSMAAGIWTKVE